MGGNPLTSATVNMRSYQRSVPRNSASTSAVMSKIPRSSAPVLCKGTVDSLVRTITERYVVPQVTGAAKQYYRFSKECINKMVLITDAALLDVVEHVKFLITQGRKGAARMITPEDVRSAVEREYASIYRQSDGAAELSISRIPTSRIDSLFAGIGRKQKEVVDEVKCFVFDFLYNIINNATSYVKNRRPGVAHELHVTHLNDSLNSLGLGDKFVG